VFPTIFLAPFIVIIFEVSKNFAVALGKNGSLCCTFLPGAVGQSESKGFEAAQLRTLGLMILAMMTDVALRLKMDTAGATAFTLQVLIILLPKGDKLCGFCQITSKCKELAPLCMATSRNKDFAHHIRLSLPLCMAT
jgi:hypothetical protein